MNPAAAQAVAEGAKGVADYFTAREQSKAQRKMAKEQKRKTLADLLNAALGREFEAEEGRKKRSSDLAQRRAEVLQNIASQYVQAFR